MIILYNISRKHIIWNPVIAGNYLLEINLRFQSTTKKQKTKNMKKDMSLSDNIILTTE